MTRPLRILISSGPTREPIDPVRFVSNYSTGYLGRCLAAEALRRGHRVTLVSGPTDVPGPRGVRLVAVERALDMQQALRRAAPKADIIIMAAAVSDFQPVRLQRRKLPRRGRLQLQLKATPDIIGTLPRRSRQLVVGFALETTDALMRARQKLRAKHLDLIVGQSLNGRSPFGRSSVKAFLLDAWGRIRRLGRLDKPRLARIILDEIERLWYGGMHVKGEG